MLKIIGLIGCLASFPATAELYQWTDKSGQIHFSDTAPKDNPDLAPKALQVNSAMPATKIAVKPITKTGPRVIEIGTENSQSACGTKGNGIAGKGYDGLQDYIWKNCHGMK